MSRMHIVVERNVEGTVKKIMTADYVREELAGVRHN